MPGGFAQLQRGERQRAIGDEFTRRHEDDPGDGEHEYQRQRQQRVNRTVGHAILRKQQRDREIHRWMPVRIPVS